jgi:glycosyltransferase 2 family protein
LEQKKRKKLNLKKIAGIAGYIIAAVSLFYIFRVGYIQWERIKTLFKFSERWPGILLAIIMYTALRSLMLSQVWKNLISGFGWKINFKESFIILGRSQIAKYIPGNVFHYLGRHLLSKNIGIPNGIIINSIFSETILLVTSSVFIFFISAIIYGYRNFIFEGINNLIVPVTITAGIIILLLLIAFFIFKFIPGIKEKLLRHNMIVNLKSLNIKKLWINLLSGLMLCMIFFFLTGLIMWYLDEYFWGESRVLFLFFIGTNAVAWVAGFITPGASGGIGVREVVIIALLAPYIGQPEALVLAIILRLVTMCGDLLSFAMTYFFKIGKKAIPKPDI